MEHIVGVGITTVKMTHHVISITYSIVIGFVGQSAILQRDAFASSYLGFS